MSEVIDFSKIPVPTATEFLEPGMYRLKVDKDAVKLETPQGKTPYLSVRFVSDKGASLTEKFFLTKKAIPRFQYLHQAWFGKEIDKVFNSYEEIGEYFAKALVVKIVSRPMVTGGKIGTDGRFYSGLPYLGFVVDESLFEEGSFEKDGEAYNRVVQKQKINPSVANTDITILPEGEDNPW